MDGEGSVDKYVKTEDVALTQAFPALFGVFMETLKACILLLSSSNTRSQASATSTQRYDPGEIHKNSFFA